MRVGTRVGPVFVSDQAPKGCLPGCLLTGFALAMVGVGIGAVVLIARDPAQLWGCIPLVLLLGGFVLLCVALGRRGTRTPPNDD